MDRVSARMSWRMNKVVLHQMVLFGAWVVLLFFKLISGDFVFDLSLLWWLLGSVIGFLFVFSDRFIYSFLMKPEEALGKRLREVFARGRVVDGLITMLNERHEQNELAMRNVLFLIVWLVMALLTVTSVASPVARGFMLGIGVHLVFDLVFDYYLDKSRFDMWFWQIKREVRSDEKRGFVLVVSIIFFLLALNF